MESAVKFKKLAKFNQIEPKMDRYRPNNGRIVRSINGMTLNDVYEFFRQINSKFGKNGKI